MNIWYMNREVYASVYKANTKQKKQLFINYEIS